MDIPLETEAKFICPEEIDKNHVADIAQSLGMTITWHAARQQKDVYFDSKDLRLFKSDVSLRCRKEITDNKARKSKGTLKIPKSRDGAILKRYEKEWEIAASSSYKSFIASFPEDVKQSLAIYSVDQTSLSPVLEVLTMRHIADISSTTGLDIEFAFDESIFSGQLGEVRRGEIEMEMKQGIPEEFAQFIKRIQEVLNLHPSSSTKYAFGIKAVVSGNKKEAIHTR